ncbi:phospholipase D/nuclease [Sporormia fimetaria CBS 119925]|uniref:Phospholipase n=1 Tax=Sporormia fimetaria CBS 119925 TaxID=1340428 RepID=A0A6A6V9L7_9PLEO|nr:phospholipase D/nuclease [Sporormia fimetaria CBS 119925]
MAYNRRDDDLAYGKYHRQGGQESGEGERGFIGDVGKMFFGGGKKQEGEQSQSSSSPFGFDKLHKVVHGIGSEIKDRVSGKNDVPQTQGQQGSSSGQQQPAPGQEYHSQHRFLSFAPERHGNDIKWYVDGCSYFWALSVALERARESIWILDWWLSPELYLRRPPAKFQQYRLDRMLEAAAKRGVNINIIVYKEVTQALTLSSSHTKHHLEKLHPNIHVFRHPDHLPDAKVLQSTFLSSWSNMSFTAANLAQMPLDSLKTIYGAHDGTVLYWAHHEKLCLIDGDVAFMGGLDACYGRWDTNSHPISDAHPGDLDQIIFPGQDYNNARIMDFQDVPNWENNKLDRTQSSRMGWTDVSVSLVGPVVQDLRTHFAQRWNFIYDEKYSKKASHYTRLSATRSGAQEGGHYPPPPTQQRGYDDYEERDRGFGGHDESGERGMFGRSPRGREGGFRQTLVSRVSEGIHHMESRYDGTPGGHGQYQSHSEHSSQRGGTDCQIARSVSKWSHNGPTEHSIQNAYCEIIRNSKHFIYIENQFFITATGDQQKPVKNQIGAAIVERIVRAARNGEKYKMIVMMPAVPAFAGDLQSDDALGTRAIMEFQYESINRGGHSIYEKIAQAGVDPTDYIRFYNLRSYDRINVSGAMRAAEQQSGVSYQQASNERDAAYETRQGGYNAYRPPPTAGYGVYEMDGGSGGRNDGGYGGGYGGKPMAHEQYQQGASQIGGRSGLGSGRWDSVSECYMLGGEDIRNVPWEGGAMNEIDAFVSEELYIHSKLLIADDQIVICGSANLNDRSQLGDHDSEIVIIVQDPNPIESTMNGRPWRASRFATSLRRQIFRKHLGLLKHQLPDHPDANWEPVGVPNVYDWGSREDLAVADPLSDEFLNHWNWRARINTESFEKVFHPVPTDHVTNWKEYQEYYSRFFNQQKKDNDPNMAPSKYKWGHVVAENFAPGQEGVRQVKEELSKIRGTLVEMPLLFLKGEDIAQEGVGLNAFTEELYT